MADDLEFEADKLLAELGITSGGGEGAPAKKPSASVSVSVSAGGPPPPPGPPAPPPPPPPAPSASGGGRKINLKTSGASSVQDAQKELDDIFDSVISFADKKSAKKKGGAPPPVAPKPKRKVHVSSYSMQVKKKDGAPGLPPPPSEPPKPPPAPKGAPAPVALPKLEPKKASGGGVAPAPPPAAPAVASSEEPIAQVAFGPGLETFEVNCFGDFQLSCAPDVTKEDLEIIVTGPSGTKPVEIDEHGNGQFSCSYLPTMAGDHKVEILVNDKHIIGSPFTAHVQFAAYTDKCSAEGPGLVSGTTTDPCCFKIRTKDGAGFARMKIHIVGPSKAEPVEMVENTNDNSVDVTYHPSAAGDYTIRVLWGDAHVHGSPFTVPVSGETLNDPSRVKVSGAGLKGGNVNEPIKLFIEGEAGAGPGPLGVRMVGPAKPTIVADDSKEEGVELTVTCRDPGEYQLILKWGQDEVPNSPFIINVVGEGREVHPEKCTASGKGILSGNVGEAVSFTVDIPDEAGPGTLGVSVSGPHPPKPIDIVNNQDGSMVVTYHPIAPGDYKIEVLWADQHISGSPFTATVSGEAVRNAKNVHATGEVIQSGWMKCNQLGTLTVTAGEGAGPGPLRAKLEGPTKADLQLTANEDGTMLVSFIPKEHGGYKLHLLWGDGEEEANEIADSPFKVQVEKN